MIALILFRPRDFPDRRNFLENEYLVYLFIMNEHLAHTCADSVEAKTKFLEILSLIEEFLTLARLFLAILDKVDSSQITHFIKEVFNLWKNFQQQVPHPTNKPIVQRCHQKIYINTM